MGYRNRFLKINRRTSCRRNWLKAIGREIKLALPDGSDFANDVKVKVMIDPVKDKIAMKNSDDFLNIKNGLPDEKSSDKAKSYFLIIFIVLGLLLALAIILLGLLVKIIEPSIAMPNSLRGVIIILVNVGGTTAYTALISFMVGTIQIIIFSGRIKTRRFVYLLFLVIGGAAGGLIGSLLLHALYILGWYPHNVSSFLEKLMASLIWSIIGFVVGIITGGIIGFTSSIMQNYIMKNTKYGIRWFLYNLISWSIIYSVGLAISLGLGVLIEFPFMGDAIASVIIMVSHGVSIVLFLNYSPQIEFS